MTLKDLIGYLKIRTFDFNKRIVMFDGDSNLIEIQKEHIFRRKVSEFPNETVIVIGQRWE